MSEEKNLQNYHSLQELKENFSLTELLKFAKGKLLSEWLEMNYYFSDSKKIFNAVDNQIDDAELKLLICKIFNIDFNNLTADELEEISALVGKNQRKELFLKYDNAAEKSEFVETQGELVKALQDGANTLYLYGAEFNIPVELHDKIYIGCNNAVIDFTHESDIDLDARNIIFEDVQIYLHHPITLKMEKSQNVKILNGTKKALGVRPTLKEIFEIMCGRNAFETAEKFKKRAEDLRGVAVGETLLEDKNYTFDTNNFAFNLQWNLDFVSIVKDFARDKNFFLTIAPEHAERLYTNERKLQIFADFTYVDGKLTILNLYFETVTLGRIKIESVLREMLNKISSGGGRGYGLHIITAYKD